jgi:hypothetical protein
MNGTDAKIEGGEVRRKRGRPVTGANPVLFARVPPAVFEAVRRKSEQRGVVASVLIREAIDLLLNNSGENSKAA